MSDRLQILQKHLDMVERIRRASQLSDLHAALREVTRDHGFETFCLTGVPDPGRKLDGYMIVAGWPDGWMERYHAEDYVQHDPVVAKLRRTSLPFVWSEAVPAFATSPLAARVMAEAAEFGMRDGFCVPIYSPRDFQAAFSLGGSRVELSEAERGLLHLVGIHAHLRVIELAGSPAWEERPRLTERETECLRWTAAGKTAWEIAQILAISEETATAHLRAAARKLDACNRTHAVALAIRHGLIA